MIRRSGDSRLDAQFTYHALHPSDQIVDLLFRAILLAVASHRLHASDEDFRLHPRFPDFDRKNVRSAISVVDLGGTEQIPGDFQPEEVLNLRGACMLEEIPADLAQI